MSCSIIPKFCIFENEFKTYSSHNAIHQPPIYSENDYTISSLQNVQSCRFACAAYKFFYQTSVIYFSMIFVNSLLKNAFCFIQFQLISYGKESRVSVMLAKNVEEAEQLAKRLQKI
jgi:hypothetical protein